MPPLYMLNSLDPGLAAFQQAQASRPESLFKNEAGRAAYDQIVDRSSQVQAASHAAIFQQRQADQSAYMQQMAMAQQAQQQEADRRARMAMQAQQQQAAERMAAFEAQQGSQRLMQQQQFQGALADQESQRRAYEFEQQRMPSQRDAFEAQLRLEEQARAAQQRMYEFETNRTPSERDVFELQSQQQLLGQRQAFDYQRDQIGHQQQMEQQQARFELTAQLQKEELTFQEQQRLKLMKQRVAEVMNDPSLSQADKNDIALQLKTGIDPLEHRQRRADMLAKQQQAQAFQEQHQMKMELAQREAKFQTDNFESHAFVDPRNGDLYYQTELGKWGHSPNRQQEIAIKMREAEMKQRADAAAKAAQWREAQTQKMEKEEQRIRQEWSAELQQERAKHDEQIKEQERLADKAQERADKMNDIKKDDVKPEHVEAQQRLQAEAEFHRTEAARLRSGWKDNVDRTMRELGYEYGADTKKMNAWFDQYRRFQEANMEEAMKGMGWVKDGESPGDIRHPNSQQQGSPAAPQSGPAVQPAAPQQPSQGSQVSAEVSRMRAVEQSFAPYTNATNPEAQSAGRRAKDLAVQYRSMDQMPGPVRREFVDSLRVLADHFPEFKKRYHQALLALER